ncbi:hypothetical protein [Desulfobacter curvatus]|uniref:hypothetical protein n=1 Tax=Desulfobacter curvatus TaxID=2290 RepID=UPI00037011A4|nr:hypothetical protein [Desulfobacter curvatus]
MKFLFIILDMKSHALRCIQLAKVIESELGATVEFLSKANLSIIEKNKYKCHPYNSLNYEKIILSDKTEKHNWISYERMLPVIEEQIVLIQKVEPDYIVTDMSFTGIIAAECCNIPTIAIHNGMFTDHLNWQRNPPSSHPFFSILIRTPQLIKKKLLPIPEKFYLGSLHKVFCDLRKHFKLPQRKSYYDEFNGDYTLICDDKDFAPQKKLPHNIMHLGPLYHISTVQESNIIKKLDKNKKTILVSLGSTGDISRLDCLNDNIFSTYNIIIAGKNIFGISGSHVICKEFIELESVYDHIDIALTQAGTGNIYQALSHAVPVLCFPTFFEQEWNSCRIKELKLGDYFLGSISGQILKEKIDKWLKVSKNQFFQDVAKRIALKNTLNNFRKQLKIIVQEK